MVEPAASSVRVNPRLHSYIAATDLKFWEKALREAERELDAATTRTALDAAAKKSMRAKAELKRMEAEVSA